MTTAIDIGAYLRRIGYRAGECRAALDTLRDIHVRHAQTIAFENLNPLLKWPVRLDAPSLEQKLVRAGRGGYCFEQNLLLGHVLSGVGFKVTGLKRENSAMNLDDEPLIADWPRCDTDRDLDNQRKTHRSDS